MPSLQLGNSAGVAAVGSGATKLAEITADGVNTVTVSVADARKFRAGMVVDILVKAGGAVLAAARTIDAVNRVTGVLTYSGADAAAVAGTHAIYPAGAGITDRKNVNGGASDMAGFDLPDTGSIDEMRARLKILAAANYTDKMLDTMTSNDMLYAIRMYDAPASVK